MFVAVATGDEFNALGPTLAVISYENHYVAYMGEAVVPVEEAPAVFRGAGGEFVESCP
jgi:hypothetical protein